MTRIFAALAAIAIIASSQLLTSTVAEAHERRNVGPYQFVVGWLDEPAFQGQPNAASVRISDTRVTPAKPVEGLEKTLSIAISAGGLAPYAAPTRAVFGQPGLYAVDLIPTRAGAYSFKMTGKVETLDVNETFESGPGRFNDVEGQNALQYPAKAPVADELAQRLGDLQATADRTQLIAIAALALGVIAMVASVALARRRA